MNELTLDGIKINMNRLNGNFSIDQFYGSHPIIFLRITNIKTVKNFYVARRRLVFIFKDTIRGNSKVLLLNTTAVPKLQ